jgi:hypothetical protein
VYRYIELLPFSHIQDHRASEYTADRLAPCLSTAQPPVLRLPVCLSSCFLSAWLSNYLPVCFCLFFYPPVCLLTSLSISTPAYLSIYLSACLPSYLPVCPPTILSTCLPACHPIYLSACLPSYLPVPAYHPVYLPVCLPPAL